MSDHEITVTNIKTLARAVGGNVAWDRMQAEVIYLFLLELGATKDIKFFWNEETGKVHITQKFFFSEDKEGSRYYTLHDYIKLLIRFDRSANKRMKNVKSKINSMYQAIEVLRKQL